MSGAAKGAIAGLTPGADPVGDPEGHAESHRLAAEPVGEIVGEPLPRDVEAVGDVEGLAHGGLVAQCEHGRVDEVLDVAEPCDRAPVIDQHHVPAADRARDLADDLR